MKKKLLIFGAFSIALLGWVWTQNSNTPQEEAYTEAAQLRASHQQFLENSPMNATINLDRAERKALGIPPNAFNEQEFNLTMDPALGFPVPRRTYDTYAQLVEQFGADRSPGSSAETGWEERGPFNTAGRVRGMAWDPNDATAKRVFAGGVSGGLYVIDDITSASANWELVTGVPGNIAVSAITFDPTDPQLMYVATGEQYTQGAANGNGIYKSLNGGSSFFQLNVELDGGGDIIAGGNDLRSGLFYVNDIIAWENPATSNVELFAGIGSAGYVGSSGGGTSSPSNVLGLQNSGLYRSTNDGATWSRVEQAEFAYTYFGNTFYTIPNDFEISADNTLYFSTIRSGFLNAGFGGRIYSTNDAVWELKNTLTATNRSQIAVSGTNPDVMYAVGQGTTAGVPVRIFRTDDGWDTFTTTSLPDDADTGIPSNDYTRGQSFYDLMLEVDPTDDDILYVGGIDMFRSADAGASWDQISKWSFNNLLGPLPVSLVHADIHEMLIRPGFPDESITATDGGVFYATTLAGASSSTSAIPARNRNLNVTQFYYGDISTDASTGDDLAGGTQDNGTLFRQDAGSGTGIFIDRLGGDGGYTEIDAASGYAITSFPGNSHIYVNYPIVGTATGYTISSGGGGFFINPAGLDKNLDILYANGQSGANERILRYDLGPASATLTVLDNALIENSAPVAFKVSPFTTASSKLFIGTTTGRVIRLDNADTTPTWTNISGPGFVGSVSDIEFGENEDQIFVTFHNYGVDNVWYTADGGTTWENKEGNLPDIPVKCVLQNPLNPLQVLIGTELGVWATDDITAASPDWFPSDSGMLDIVVRDLDLRESDNTILASTHGRGMFTNKFNTLGLGELSNPLESVVVFPTVSDGQFNLQSTQSFDNTVLEVYNMSGQKVGAQNVNLQAGSPVSLDYRNLASGLYFIKLNSDGLETTKRFVIR